MHTYALAFHCWKLDFQSPFDHNREEEREEKRGKLEAAVKVIVEYASP